MAGRTLLLPLHASWPTSLQYASSPLPSHPAPSSSFSPVHRVSHLQVRSVIRKTMSHSMASSTRPGASPLPPHASVNTQTKVIDTVAGRILCIADVRGKLSSLNDMAREVNAKAIIHTGDFGFFGESHPTLFLYIS